MDTGCPVHAAAQKSCRSKTVGPLLRTRRARTEECGRCRLCRKAMECLTDTTEASWGELWGMRVGP